MRVIAGRHKGRRLKSPAWDGLRPTSDKLRETLFNVLGPRVVDARVFDGYAGTGAVGIEALSRGAAHVTFVDRDRRAAALIAENLAACAIEQGYTIQCTEVGAALEALPERVAFDLILLDPPYDTDRLGGVLAAASRHVTDDGLVVLEHPTRREPEVPAGLTRTRDIASGDSSLALLRREAGVRKPGSEGE